MASKKAFRWAAPLGAAAAMGVAFLLMRINPLAPAMLNWILRGAAARAARESLI